MLIKEIAKIYNGSTPSTANPRYWDGQIPWITPKDLSINRVRYISKGERNITDEGYKSCSTTLLPPNTVLLTSRAPIGYVSISQNTLCTNQGFKSLVCDEDKVLPLYLYYWLTTKAEFLKSISTGATFKELSKNTLERVEISLPSLNEQQHIVDTIGSVDDLIEKNEEIIKKSTSFIDATFNDLFTKSNFTYSTLGSTFNVSIGRTPPTKESKWFANKDNADSISWLSIKDMNENEVYCLSTSQFLTTEAINEFHYTVAQPGDILLSFKLTVGRVLIAGKEMLTNEAIACFKGNEELKRFLYCYLKTCNFLSDGGNTSSIGKAINSKIIKNFSFPIPPKDMLQKFTDLTRRIFELIRKLQDQNNLLKKEKEILLNRFFGSC